MSSPPLTAGLTTLPSGRRFTVCPSCTAITSPVAENAIELDCRHCGAHFALVAVVKRKRPARKRPKQEEAPIEGGGGDLDGNALAELYKAR